MGVVSGCNYWCGGYIKKVEEVLLGQRFLCSSDYCIIGSSIGYDYLEQGCTLSSYRIDLVKV